MLAAPDSVIGNSLRTFLSIVQEIDFIGSVNKTVNVSQYSLENKPDILVLDADLVEYDGTLTLMNYLQELHSLISPDTCIIVLAGGFEQQQAVLKSNAAQVVLKGQVGERLREKFRSYSVSQHSES